ncbi:hypothetical protein K435DRAFT_631875, partial [Dendrothele bispora CBS 962.96]
QQKLLRLYGPCFVSDTPKHAYISSSHAIRDGQPVSSFGIYWGLNNSNNCCYTIPGRSSANHALLMGVSMALRTATQFPRHELLISVSSTFVIRSFCYWMGRESDCGWPSANGPSLRLCTDLIQARIAPMVFLHVASNSGN